MTQARTLSAAALVVLFGAAPFVAAGNGTPAPEDAVRDVVGRYQRAIETKDIALFRSVKPNLSDEDEKRLRRAFESTRSQVVMIAIQSIRFEGERAEARLARRDTLDGSIVSSFPQTLRLSRAAEGWVIEEIGR